MTDYIDRELNQTISEVDAIYDRLTALGHGDAAAAILTLATVTHHQNGALP